MNAQLKTLLILLSVVLNIAFVSGWSWRTLRGSQAPVVVTEGVIAAALTALMILLFLRAWRSTLIIATSIPLSVLASLAAMSALGESINLMTLGGWRRIRTSC